MHCSESWFGVMGDPGCLWQRPVAAGGLGVLNFEYYMLAGQLQWLAQWIEEVNKEGTYLSSPDANPRLVTARVLRPKMPTPYSSLLQCTAFRAWRRCWSGRRKPTGYIPELPLVGLLHGDPLSIFTAEQLAPWTEAGIEVVGDCFLDKSLIPFDSLMEESGLPTGQFLQYEALTRTFAQLWAVGRNERETHPVLHALYTLGTARHLVKWFYVAIQVTSVGPLTSLHTKWNEIGGRELTDAEWKRVLYYPKNILETPASNIYSLIIHIWHI